MFLRAVIASGCIEAVALFLVVCYQITQAQPPNVVYLGPVVRVSALGKGDHPDLNWVHADPVDGKHLMACGRVMYPPNISAGYVYTSSDAGATWRETLLDAPPNMKWVSEESCTYGANGRAYFADSVTRANANGTDPAHGRFNFYASANHGLMWKRIWTWPGWLDWTFLASTPGHNGSPESVVIFADGAYAFDKLGRFWSKTPVAFVSSDGGRSFSGPSTTARTFASFAGGSVVVPNGTALFTANATINNADYSNWSKSHSQTRIFAFSPRDRHLRTRAIIHDTYGRFTGGAPALVQDRSRGRYHGRLYAAWSESGLRTAELWLGTSDDSGYHWLIRPILLGKSFYAPPSCQPTVGEEIKLAIDRTGTLGITWVQDEKELLGAFSRDGGRTFSRSVVIARDGASVLALSNVLVPYNEYFGAAVLAEMSGRPQSQFYEYSHLGLAIRLSRSIEINTTALVADANNTFHPVWGVAVGPDGNHTLFTRAIRASSRFSGTSSKLMSTTNGQCTQTSRGVVRPALPGAISRLIVAGQQDITKSFALQIEHIHYDSRSHSLSAKVVLVNKGTSVVQGPLLFFGVGVHSDFGIPVAQNATGVLQGQPFWDTSSVIPASGLQPGGKSKLFELRFTVERFQTAASEGDAVAMRVAIYQKP